jgi:peptidoglycan/LPS O-acetylase OafA/YrhL
METIAPALPSATGIKTTTTMPALTGIRFFAIFHIFLFHMWTLYDLDKPERFSNLVIGFADLPSILVTFFSHGWLSTSFFFLLSGFILAYLYWTPAGGLSTSKKTFWLKRALRIYPVHILIMMVTMLIIIGHYLQSGMGVFKMIGTAVLTLTLTQAWVPPAVPVWSWPTWTLSALIFLYFAMPWLMPRLARLSRQQQWILLACLPAISLIPTVIYAFLVPAGTDPGLNWTIFLGSTPLFWVPHFVAGMLLSRLLGINRFAGFTPSSPTWLAWGDLALVTVIVIACIPGIEEPMKYFLRHGLIMPLYMVVIVDLARGRGLAARLFSLPGTGFLGETGFSIFIWQNLVMTFCWMSLMIVGPSAGYYHLPVASVGIILLGVFSTYCLEKPIARKLTAKWLNRDAAPTPGNPANS